MGAASRDSYVLTSPQGSTYDLASYIDLSGDGPDFGDEAMAAHYAENPAADGGMLSFESIGIRTMRFPILVASAVTPSGLLERESQLRLAARPGATLDVTLFGYDQANPAVRFDVQTGRYKPAYRVRENMVGVRRGVLELDTPPYGYWPTSIVLASVASIGIPGKLDIPNASLIGDVPGLGEIKIVQFGAPATNYPAGTWRPDLLGWSFGGRANFTALWGGASLALADDISTGSTVGDVFAPASQGRQVVPSQNLGAWKQAVGVNIGGGLEPAYRGRHRLFAWAKLGPSQHLPWYVTGDVTLSPLTALASEAPIATLPPAVASGSPGAWGAQPSPAYTLLDLGEIDIGGFASVASSAPLVRLWISPATSNVGVATTTITFGGAYFLPVDTAAGVIPRGLVVPTTQATAYENPHIKLSAIEKTVALQPGGYVADLMAHYRGALPVIGASVTQLNLIGGERPVGAAVTATGPVVRSFAEGVFTSLSVSYRPRFRFTRGL